MPSHDLSQLQCEPRHLQQLRLLLTQWVPDAEVWAYGSRVTGQSHQGSDLDIVLRNPDDLASPQPNMFDFIEALQQSSLPILIDVHDWALLPTSFHRNIKKDYVVLQ